jgi:DedD protein
LSTPFQNRLVGTIIVAAAIIIFLPDVLDGEKQAYQADFEAIPNAPKFNGKQQNKVFPEEKLKALPEEVIHDDKAQDEIAANKLINNTSQEVQVKALSKDKKIASVKPENKVTKKKTLPEKSVVHQAWAIQLGSFRHKKNVNELLAKLKKNGYTAFSKPIKTKTGMLTKVFVGPELSKTTLEKKLPKLKQLTNVQGKVARFYPTK